jgi:hypothetical protein
MVGTANSPTRGLCTSKGQLLPLRSRSCRAKLITNCTSRQPPDAMNGYPAPTAASVWQEHTNKDDGKKYYYNTVTKLTTWEKPPELYDEVEVCGSRRAQMVILTDSV